MRTATRVGAGGALLCAWISATAAAAEPMANGQGVVLDEITVTAGRGASLQSLDMSTTSLDRIQVQQAPQTAVDQIINKIPGVFTSQQPAAQLHPTGQPFNIRGFGTTTNVNTLATVDGVPMNDPYFRTVDWSQLSKASIKRIEVIRGGGATSLWGNLAMGGVVNVVTETAGAGANRVDASYGSFNTYSGEVAWSFAPTDTLRLGASYDLVTTDGYDQTPKAYRNPYMTSTASRNQNITAAAVFTPDDASTFYVKFLDHRIRERGLVWAPTNNLWRTDRLNFGGTVNVSSSTSVDFAGWYGWNRMDTVNASTTPSYSTFDPTVGVPYVSQTEAVRYDSFGGSIFLASKFGSIKDIKAGVDFRVINARDPLNLFASSGQIGQITAQARHQFAGVFLQGVWHSRILPLEITLGLREDVWQTRNGAIDGIYRGASFASTLPDKTYSHFDPRLGAKYHLSEMLDLRAAVYEDFAAPGMNQMYRSFISGSNYTTSNPKLRPQTNLGEEVGVDVHRGGFQLSVTMFSNKLRNFIDYATTASGCAEADAFCGTGIAAIAGGSLRQYVNAGDAVLRGFEVIGNWALSDRLAFDAGFTRTDAHLTSSAYQAPSSGVIPDPVGEQLGQAPPWTVTAGATWRPVERLRLSAQLKSFPAYWNNTSHTQKNQSATIVDLGASWRFYRSFEIYGLIQNVGDVHYYDQGLGYTTTNGAVVNGVTIPALGLPRDATIGLRATF